MDEENKIRLDVEGEENIDLSLGFTAACSLYVIINSGLKTITAHHKEATQIEATMKEQNNNPILLARLQEEKKVMELAMTNGKALAKELGRVIKELDEKPKSKIIIPKPKFTNFS